VPIFVAVMVWLTRVLIIGTLSVAGDRIFSQVDLRGAVSRGQTKSYASPQRTTSRPASVRSTSLPRGVTRGVRAASMGTSSYQPAPKPEPRYESDYGNLDSANRDYGSQEPVYTPVSFSGNRDNNRQARF